MQADPHSAKVQDFMSNHPIMIHEQDPVSLILELFERTRISGAPVLDIQGKYTGVVSKTDLAGSRLWSQVKSQESLDILTAKDIMNATPLIAVHKHEPLDKAVALMLHHNVHRVFVQSKDGQLIGVLSSFDVMRAYSYNPDLALTASEALASEDEPLHWQSEMLEEAMTEESFLPAVIDAQQEGSESKVTGVPEQKIDQIKLDSRISTLIHRRQKNAYKP